MQYDEGYLLVQKSTLFQQWYASTYESSPPHNSYIRHLRQNFPLYTPDRYQGIGRNPLTRLWTTNLVEYMESLMSRHLSPEANLVAKHRLAEIVEGSPRANELTDYTDTLEQAREVYKLLDASAQDQYEIIRIVRFANGVEPNTSGFDIGYWGSGPFSILCDGVIAPVWHPVSLARMAELGIQLQVLNGNLLFPNVSAAQGFRSYYLSQAWAESEGSREEGKFHIIRVDSCHI